MGELKTTPGGLVLLGGRLCLDFCNTVVRRAVPHDMLARDQYADLVFWCQEVELIPPDLAEHYTAWGTANPDDAHTLFEGATALREAIYQVGLAAIARQAAPEEALTTLNTWTQKAMSARQLYSASDGKLGWQWQDPNALERPLWDITLSAVDVLLKEDLTRLRQCPGCGWLFYDQTKNNTRTWCDMRFCGNRAKNKRFHARQKDSES